MSLALADAPTQELEVASRLDDLRQRLDAETVDFAEALDVRDQAATVRAYVRSARLGLQLANEAMETRLRAERKAGLILLEMIAAAGPSTTRLSRRREKFAAPRTSERQVLPGHTLRRMGISGRDSSRYQQLARIEQGEFDARISATVAAGRQLSYQPFWRASRQYRREVSGRPTTPAASLLRRALRLLRDVTTVRTRDELELARQVVKIGESWSVVINPPPPQPATAIAREVSCLLCGRGRPASRPATCPSCGGRWLET